MSKVNREAFRALKKFGYAVDLQNGILTIKRRENYTLLIAFISAAILLLVLPQLLLDLKIIILFALLVLYPIVTYRTNSYSKVAIHIKDSILVALSSSLIRRDRRFKMKHSSLELVESYDYSYATALEDDNKEYCVTIVLNFPKRKPIDLFVLRSRNKNDLEFAREIFEGMKNLLYPANMSQTHTLHAR